ncbi:MAG: hypothetical protein LBW85_08535 [Deltaproteobacteria bacterium]|jgi:hypothetical protein|nr:hypothetical protein [Deltaproteobacteria bacterium]
MPSILQRSVLSAPGDVSLEYPAGNMAANGRATVSLAGAWTGGVTLYHALADGEWIAVKTYSGGPEEDVAFVSAERELFRFEAISGFSGECRVIVAQGEVQP